jgi:hypothetical protein
MEMNISKVKSFSPKNPHNAMWHNLIKNVSNLWAFIMDDIN